MSTYLVNIVYYAVAAGGLSQVGINELRQQLTTANKDIASGVLTREVRITRTRSPELSQDLVARNPRLPAAMGLNQSFREKVTFDSARRIWRIDRQDLRPLPPIAAEDESLRKTISDNRVIITDLANNRIVLFSRDGTPDVMIAPLSANCSQAMPVNACVLSTDKWPAATQIVSEPHRDSIHQQLRITRQYQDHRTVTVVVPYQGWRYSESRWESREPRRVLSEIRADDFRQVNGVWYPFEYNERTYDSVTGELSLERCETVIDARFNIPIADEQFDLPIATGTVVADHAEGKYPLRSKTDGVLTLRNRAQFAQQVLNDNRMHARRLSSQPAE